jgi:hypothetical protein
MRWLFPVFAIIIAASSSAVFADDDDDSAGPPESYPRVSSLEKIILGQTYVADPLAERLSRLETKAFGAASTSDDLGDRTDLLQDYAEKKLHKQPLGAKQNDDLVDDSQPDTPAQRSSAGASSSGPSRGHSQAKSQMMSMAANSLLGLASSAVGMPGLLPALAGVGGLAANSAMQQKAPPPVETMPQDPVVTSASPPPPGARLITKVSWCEMQLFGRISPQLHLVERLRGISLELGLDTKKTNLELMDDVDSFVKAIQSRSPQRPQPPQPPDSGVDGDQ